MKYLNRIIATATSNNGVLSKDIVEEYCDKFNEKYLDNNLFDQPLSFIKKYYPTKHVVYEYYEIVEDITDSEGYHIESKVIRSSEPTNEELYNALQSDDCMSA